MDRVLISSKRRRGFLIFVFVFLTSVKEPRTIAICYDPWHLQVSSRYGTKNRKSININLYIKVDIWNGKGVRLGLRLTMTNLLLLHPLVDTVKTVTGRALKQSIQWKHNLNTVRFFTEKFSKKSYFSYI